MKLQSRVVAAGFTLALLFGCQGGNLSPQGVVSLGKANLTLRLPQATRQVMALRASADYRLTILGSDLSTPQTTTLSQAADAATIEASGIPLGRNRVIVLQALDSHGAAVSEAAWMAVASFASTKNQVELTAATTAVGRVWRRWLDTDHASFANTFTPSAVMKELDKIKTTTAVADYSLIDTRKWADDAVARNKIDLGTSGYVLLPGIVDVTVGGAPSNVPAELWVDDPASPLQCGISPNTSLTNGRYQVSPVAPGNWTLWAAVPGFGIASRSIVVAAGETLQTTLSFPGWQSAAKLPVAVGNFACTTNGRRIYVLGGVLKGGVATDSCWTLDTQSANPGWSALPNLLKPCEGAAAAIVDNKLYLVGGSSGNVKVKSCAFLDLANPTAWSAMPAVPELPVDTATKSFDYGDDATRSVYSVGYYDVDPAGAVEENHKLVVYYSVMDVLDSKPLNDCGFTYVFDPDANTWTVDPAGYPKIRTPRLRAGLALFGQLVVVAGGDQPFSQEDAGLNSKTLYSSVRVEAFDRSERRWLALPDLPTRRSELSLANAGQRLYAVGGTDYNEKPLDTVECYNPATRTWNPGPPLKTPRSAFGLVYAGGKLWAIGGSPSRFLNRTEIGALAIDEVESLGVGL